MKIFCPFVLAALAAFHGVDAEMSDSACDGPPHELGGRMLSEVEDIAVPISRNTQGCTSVAFLGSGSIANKVLSTMGMVNGEASCNANFCNALYMSSYSQSTIMQQLGNFDVLVILNGNNGSPPLSAANKVLVDAALGDGSLKALMVYDRYANRDPNIPGLQYGDTVRTFDTFNEPHPSFAGQTPISGPFGNIGTFRGNYASHGYIKQSASVIATAEEHIRMSSSKETTTIQYDHGSGRVLYSTIPLDFYFYGSNNIYINTIFPNALCHLSVNSPPIASCTDVTVSADGTCQASNVGIDNGSSDPDGDELSFSQAPPGPYGIGETTVILTANDGNGGSDTCSATVTVTNSPPVVDPTDASVIFVDGASGAPADNGELTVTAADPEGQLLTYEWSTDCPGATIIDGDKSTAQMSIAAGTESSLCSVTIKVCDVCGACTTPVPAMVVVVDPAGGFVTGGGWFDSPQGAYVPDPTAIGKANFGFVSKYKKGQSIPSGDTQFVFATAGLVFESTSYEWLVITGSDCAKYKGMGTLNEASGYGFMLTACDGGEPGVADTFRIKIWDAQDAVVYDNQLGADEDSYDGTIISGGNIQIHQSGGKKLRG